MGIIKISEKSDDLLQSVTECLSCHNPHLSISLTMKAISSPNKANVISVLLSGHSIRKVESITDLGKSIVGRIY